MNKEQTALDVSRDIEVAKVMPQQAAQTLTDTLKALCDEFSKHPQLKSFLGREALILRCVESVQAAKAAEQKPVAYMYEFGEYVAFGPHANIMDYFPAQEQEIVGVPLYAAPKVDAAVPADLGARAQTDFVSLAGFLATAVLEYPDFDCDNEAEPRPLCSLARQVLAAASQGAPKEAEPVAKPDYVQRFHDEFAQHWAACGFVPDGANPDHIYAAMHSGFTGGWNAAVDDALAAPAVAQQDSKGQGQ